MAQFRAGRISEAFNATAYDWLLRRREYMIALAKVHEHDGNHEEAERWSTLTNRIGTFE